MAQTGILGQSKPAANTNTLLYKAPYDQSASSVLTITNDGTGSAYSVGIKDWSQKLTVGASNYLLHEGDIFTSYRITMNNTFDTNAGFTGGLSLTTDDGEKSFNFESYFVPEFTTIFVKEIGIRQITVESVTGSFVVGDTVTTGASPNDTTATLFAVNTEGALPVLYLGPSTINGTGAEFAEGDVLSTAGGASGTVAAGGIAAEVNSFIFSTTTAGGTYDYAREGLEVFTDRAYRFDVSDSSMAGRDFKLSTTQNGEWGPDNVIGGSPSDDGTEYTTNKTSNGTAGSSGAYVQYDFSGTNLAGGLYYYDGGTGTASNNVYGGVERSLNPSNAYSFTSFYIYNLSGTPVVADTFTYNDTTYTIDSVDAGPHGYIRSYSGSSLKVCLGTESAAITTSDTFRDNPKLATATRTVVTVNSVDAGVTDLDAENYITQGATNAANNVDRITSLVVGPCESVVVNSTTQNNAFTMVGYEDTSTAFTVRTNTGSYGTDTGGGGGGLGGGGGAAP